MRSARGPTANTGNMLRVFALLPFTKGFCMTFNLEIAAL